MCTDSVLMTQEVGFCFTSVVEIGIWIHERGSDSSGGNWIVGN